MLTCQAKRLGRPVLAVHPHKAAERRRPGPVVVEADARADARARAVRLLEGHLEGAGALLPDNRHGAHRAKVGLDNLDGNIARARTGSPSQPRGEGVIVSQLA